MTHFIRNENRNVQKLKSSSKIVKLEMLTKNRNFICILYYKSDSNIQKSNFRKVEIFVNNRNFGEKNPLSDYERGTLNVKK